jgi:hypothetical protein
MDFFRIFLNPFDISFKRLREATLYLGYNPRQCFSAALSAEELAEKKSDVRWWIRGVSIKESIFQVLTSTQMGDSNVSRFIFQIYPEDEERYYAQCNFDAVSRWALDVFLEDYENRKADAAVMFYHEISRMPETALLRGHIFERQVLKYLDSINAERKFMTCGLAASEETTWTYRGRVTRYTFLEDLDFIEEIKTAVENKTPLHLVPPSRNFPSILYDPNEGLTCIQITVNKVHPISVSSLQHIQGWLGRDPQDTRLAGLRGLRASTSQPWRFIFIVPEEMEAGFELQRLGGDKTGVWAEMVHQYVLGFDVLGRKPGRE